MSPFEYVIVLISIILGLGITTILTGVAELIKHTRPIKLYAPYLIWIALIFVLHIQEWWISYQLMSVKVWTLQQFLLIVFYPINLYILAHLLFPNGLSNTFNSKEFFLNHFPRLFIGSLTLVIASVIHNLTFLELSIVRQIPQLMILVILGAVLVTKSKSSTVHYAVSLFLLTLMIVAFVLDNHNLVIQ